MASLVTIAKQYLKAGLVDKRPLKQNYVNSTCFQFLERPSGKQTKSSVEGWLVTMVKEGLQDIKLLTGWSKEDRSLAIFANSLPCLMLCVWENKSMTFWSKSWVFNQVKGAWDITYTEQAYPNPPQKIPAVADPTMLLEETLLLVKQLAEELRFDYFAGCFAKAYRILIGKECIELTLLPEKNQRIMAAASSAFVFGGMDSWNDSPPWEAQRRGLAKEYEVLSDALYQLIMQAVMYAVNEW